MNNPYHLKLESNKGIDLLVYLDLLSVGVRLTIDWFQILQRETSRQISLLSFGMPVQYLCVLFK